MSSRLIELIQSTVQEVCDLEQIENPELGADVVLFGRQGFLDSAALVNVVVAVEEAIEDELDVSVTLADERAMSYKRNPFRSIGALAEYAALRIEEARSDD